MRESKDGTGMDDGVGGGALGDGERRLLERLGAESEWTGGGTQVWRASVRASRRARRVRVAGFAAAACLVLSFVGVFAFSGVQGQRGAVGEAGAIASGAGVGGAADGGGEGALAMRVEDDAGDRPLMPMRSARLREDASVEVLAFADEAIDEAVSKSAAAPASARPVEAAGGVAVRAVAFTDRLTVEVDSVVDAFASVRGLVDESLGEYVSGSDFRSDGARASATVSLRVLPSRRGAVGAALAGLGAVVAQSSDAADVGERVVDLSARLRNERRVEVELAELLDSRSDAPLGEVLELRRSLDGVRVEIERLTAQLARVETRVALATVVVELRERAAEDGAGGGGADGEDGTLMGELGAEVSEAWASGARGLIASVGFVVRVVVGGAVLWAAVLGVWLIAVRLRGVAVA